jgi:hypothetical protein
MYKMLSAFVGFFETASECRPSISLCASLAVDLFPLYFLILIATSQKYFVSIKKLFQHKRQTKTYADNGNFF